ncbi:MAG: peptidase C39 family protein [Deltaproteobacteria bacterium]|nr:peptidase C39 family protein [Deltaproteobacteria bacterium]
MEKGAPVEGGPFLLFLIILFVFSCAGPARFQESRGVRAIENVPFFPQEAYQCGPASLAGVLNFWGLKVSPEEIAADIYSKAAQGTLDVDMVFYAERKGLQARQYQGGWEDFKKSIDSGIPLIILVDYGFWVYQQNHFMVVIGYDENAVIAHSGKERNKVFPRGIFLKTWERANFWTLQITPKP